MAVSKRLRFEILRRDNHTCRYCGATPPDAVITVDHVSPVALGGKDEPANLVAACVDCNAGKSSIPADATVVEDVAADAVRWARAMKAAAIGRAIARSDSEERYSFFLTVWNNWTFQYMGERKTVDLPSDWRQSIDQFLYAGLEMEDLRELVDVAMQSKTRDEWRYFCGCCWRRIKQSHEQARAIIEVWDSEEGIDG